jgi:hypothetical protein
MKKRSDAAQKHRANPQFWAVLTRTREIHAGSEYHGALGGYGALNQAGLVCQLSMVSEGWDRRIVGDEIKQLRAACKAKGILAPYAQ